MSSSTDRVPTLPLQGHGEIPQLGFGVWEVPAGDTADVVTHALAAGYRHIDTATIYGNEAGVGQAIHASGLTRDEVFVTTKCFNNDQGRDKAMRACKHSLEQLGMEYVDLYLIHWPVPSADLYVETWKAFIELREEGLVRAIGVSNFHIHHLQRLIDETGVVPVLNQVELHPWLPQRQVHAFDDDHGILTESWSPLARGRVIGDPVLDSLAGKHGVSPAQIVIRWHVQQGIVVIPKSVSIARIRQNADVFGFELDNFDMVAIAGIETGERTGMDPDDHG